MKTWTFLNGANTRQLMLRNICCVFVALFLAGCATGSTRVDISGIEAPPPDKTRIFVIRPNYDFGSLLDLGVSVNGTHVANLKNLSYTTFFVAPGWLTIANEGMSWPRKSVTIVTEGGTTQFISWALKDTSFPPNYSISMSSTHWQQLTKQDAQTLLNSTNYVPPAVDEVPSAK